MVGSFEVNHGNDIPAWIQLRNRLAYLISSGSYQAGDRLPAVRALAAQLDICNNTVSRAYMDLERDGYVSSRKGRGTFVAEGKGAVTQSGSFAIGSMFEDAIRSARSLGMSDGDILSLVQEKVKRS